MEHINTKRAQFARENPIPGAVAPTRTPDIEVAMSELMDTIAALEKAHYALVDRVRPVMRDNGPQTGASSPTALQGACALSAALRSLTIRLEALVHDTHVGIDLVEL